MIHHISGYKFIHLDKLRHLQTELTKFCKKAEIKGTILLSEEGANINLAGQPQAIDSFQTYIKTKESFNDIIFKKTECEKVPYRKMMVKIKEEIIRFGAPNIDTSHNEKFSVKPEQLKQWLDEGKQVTLLDTRNDYECKIGTFENAVTYPIHHFTQLPEAMKKLLEIQKENPIVMFCTGGVRCDKLLPVLREQGIENVYQLDGGIINYFMKCGGAHYDGECFVFDDRVAITPELKASGAVLCKKCQRPIRINDQQRDGFINKGICQGCE